MTDVDRLARNTCTVNMCMCIFIQVDKILCSFSHAWCVYCMNRNIQQLLHLSILMSGATKFCNNVC